MKRRRNARWHGLLPVRKAAGPTSHDVVEMARRALGEQRVGHCGTLDPMAEGLLLLCIGNATRVQQHLLRWSKVYRGVIRLGHATSTYDAEGEPTDPRAEPPPLDRALLDRLEARFTGAIEQVPPPFSAKKVGGRKLYEMARNGEAVEVEPKTVQVASLRLEGQGGDRIALEVRTASGFYVRSLAHDIGLALGCGGFLEHLDRLSIGPYSASEALPQEALRAAQDPSSIIEGPHWVPLASLQLPYPEVFLNPTAAGRFVHGQDVIVTLPAESGATVAGDQVVVRALDRRLLGIGSVQAVMARGRSAAVRPATVLEAGVPGGSALR